LLLLKDNKARPLVVLRTGIFSTLQTIAPEKYLIEQLFEDGPYHVLVLSSLTGIDFRKDNDRYMFGGFEEAIQQILIGKQLRNPDFPYSHFVSGLRLAAFSMGGHGAYLTTLLNEKDPAEPQQSLYRKTLLLCPLVNFNETMNYHQNSFFNRFLINLWGGTRLKSKNLLSFSVNDFFNLLRKNYSEPLVGWSAVESVNSLQKINFSQSQASHANDFFARSNNDQDWLNKKVSTPTLVVATKQDQLVPLELNYNKITDPGVQKLLLPMGIHCSLPSAYNWKILSTTFNLFLM
jgi:hypothetical protein